MTSLKNIYQFLLTDDSKDWDLANQILIGLRISKSHRLVILARGWARRAIKKEIDLAKQRLDTQLRECINKKLRNLISYISKKPLKNPFLRGQGRLYLGRYKNQKYPCMFNYIYANDYIIWLLQTLNFIK